MKHDVTTTIRTEHRLTISKADIVEWLRCRQELVGVQPHSLDITITVPTGGDYGGDTLDLEEVGGLVVAWTAEEEEQP